MYTVDTVLSSLAIDLSPWRSALLMVIGFGLVVFFHELGHFAVAKWAGIKVEEFAIGFGKRLVGFRRGETEYRINIIPLGGYVKMLGQEDFSTKDEEVSDPRAYNNRPVWARILVVSAGVVMNVILAAILFLIVYTVGIRVIPPVVGGAVPASPADLAQTPEQLEPGLQPGDTIEAINGKPIRRFDKLKIKAMLSQKGEEFKLQVRRPGVDDPFHVVLGTQQGVEFNGARGFEFGIQPCISNTLAEDDPDVRFYEQLYHGKVGAGDRIVSIDGTPIQHGWEILQYDDKLEGQPVTIAMERAGDGEQYTITETPIVGWSREGLRRQRLAQRVEGKTPPYDYEPFNVLGLRPRVRVETVFPDTPAAEAGLQSGDIIAAYGPAGETPTIEQFHKISDEAKGGETPIRVIRDGEDAGIQAVRVVSRKGKAVVGFVSTNDTRNLVIAEVMEDSPFAGILGPGCEMIAVNGRPVSSWSELIRTLETLKQSDSADSLVIDYRTPAGQAIQTEPISLASLDFQAGDYGYDLPIVGFCDALMSDPIRAGPIGAMKLAVADTGDFIVTTYATLHGFLTQRVSGKSFSGPVGIFRAGIKVGERGIVWLVWLMAVISANLAVINFLPLPIVDGGHVVMLAIEGIRRKPLSVAIQNAVQIAGLAMLGLVFILLTYNDIVQWLRQG